MNREICISDLDAWISRMGEDSSAKGQAFAIAGLLLDDPELMRQGIAADPHNPHTLFIGANFNTETGSGPRARKTPPTRPLRKRSGWSANCGNGGSSQERSLRAWVSVPVPGSGG